MSLSVDRFRFVGNSATSRVGTHVCPLTVPAVPDSYSRRDGLSVPPLLSGLLELHLELHSSIFHPHPSRRVSIASGAT